MHNVPRFPGFRRISLEDQHWYNDYYRYFKPYADFSFGNLIIWLDQYDDLEISQLNDNLVLKCTTLFMNKQLMLTFLGKNDVKDTIEQLFSYQQENGLKQELLGIPEQSISALLERNDADFEFTNDRDNDEYMMDAGHIASLESKHMRRKVTAFRETYGEQLRVEELDMSDQASVALLKQGLEKWPEAYATNGSSNQEQQVMERTLAMAPQLGHKNVSIYVDNVLVAFSLYQPVPQKGFVIVNHMKANYEYHNAFIFTTYTLAQRLHDAGIGYMNYEQDLGIPGLRDYKERLHPVYFLKKYIIRPAQAS